MTLNLKNLPLLLIAVVTLGATFLAPTAQATPQITTEESPVTFEGREGGRVLTAFGSQVTCTFIHYHSPLTGTPTSTLTIEAEYTECTGFGGLITTVTMNSCSYVIHLKSRVATNYYDATTDIACPEGKQIEFHVYGSATAHKEGKALCTVTIPAQTGLSAPRVTTITLPGSNYGDGTIEGSVEHILAKQNRNSFLCPAGTEDPKAQFDIEPFTLQGKLTDWDISGE